MGLTANRQYKDTVFRDLFGSEERKENALSLYNALAGTDYDDPALLQFTTLSRVIYLNYKNDVSFLIDDQIILWEHQSTLNPNMPLRGAVYFGKLFSVLIRTRQLDVYGSGVVKLPTPHYFVFYNGTKALKSEELRLSDSFDGEGDIEVRCTVVDVNADSGASVLEACETLRGYSETVQRIRENAKTMELSEAVDAAIDSCIADGILADYLLERRAEVKDMFMTEFDEEQRRAWDREEGREEGRQEGVLTSIRNLMESMGLDAVKAMDALGVPEVDRDKYLERIDEVK